MATLGVLDYRTNLHGWRTLRRYFPSTRVRKSANDNRRDAASSGAGWASSSRRSRHQLHQGRFRLTHRRHFRSSARLHHPCELVRAAKLALFCWSWSWCRASDGHLAARSASTVPQWSSCVRSKLNPEQPSPSQDPWLTAGTVAENIAFGPARRTSPNREGGQTGLHPFVHQEFGVGSRHGDQRRRVESDHWSTPSDALARAVLRNPAVLLIEGPTTDLDTLERVIAIRAIRQVSRGGPPWSPPTVLRPHPPSTWSVTELTAASVRPSRPKASSWPQQSARSLGSVLRP